MRALQKYLKIGVPSDWKLIPLKKIVNFNYGFSLTEESRVNGQFPVYGSNGIVGYHNEFKIEGNGIVVGRKGTAGNVIWAEKNFYPIDTTFFVTPKNDDLDLKWLFYLLSYSNLEKFGSATGVPGLSRNDVYMLLVPKPEKKEQHNIACILSTVDETIKATKNTIAKAERLKKALMQNLLTGKLKPNGIWRKENDFYKDEKVGIVPIGWKVEKLKKVFKLSNGKGNPSNNLQTKPEGDFNVPVYGGNGITGYFNKPFLRQSTLIIGRVGEYCGSVYKTPEKCWVTDNALWISDIFEEAFDLDFWFLKLSDKQLNQYGDATGQPKITQSGIGNLKTIYPENKIEQNEIAKIILEIETTLESKLTKVEKLERLKKALMQNLLTGRVRIKMK